MKPRLVDTHAHLQFQAYAGETDALLEKTRQAGIWVNVVGTQSDTSRLAVETAERLGDGVFASIGLHPNHLTAMEFDEDESHIRTREERFDPDVYAPLAASPKVIAVGECGLDYYRLPDGVDFNTVQKIQHEGFLAQLDFADAHDLPTVIHCRDGSTPETRTAHADIIRILTQRFAEGKNVRRGVMHCYTGDWQTAEQYLQLGMYISFSGIVTFPPRAGATEGGEGLQEAAKKVPEDKLLIETDAPYLSPVPLRGKRNEPVFVEHVAAYLAQIRSTSLEEISRITTINAQKAFPRMVG